MPARWPLRQRRGERVGPVAVVAPLVGVGVPEGGADHLARRTLPVGGHRHRGPAGHRAALLLAHVVRPAAAVAPHRTGEQQQREHRAVGGVAVEPLADPRPHDDHGAALRLLGVVGHLPGDPHDLLGGHRGDRFLPGRACTARPGRRSRWATTPGSPSRCTPYWASIRSKTVVTSRPPTRRTGTPRRSTPPEPSRASKRGNSTSAASTSAGIEHRELRGDVTELEVPAPDARLRCSGTRATRSARPARRSGRRRGRSSTPRPHRRHRRSAAVRNLPGTYAPSCSSSVTRNGRSVNRCT